MIKNSIVDQLILHEGLRTEAYKCPAGFWTIGVGRNLEAKGLTKNELRHIYSCDCSLGKLELIDAVLERGITKDDALFLLENDIADCEQDLGNFDWFDELDPIRRKVVVDMRFNLGRAGFRQFKRMIAALEVGDYEQAAIEMVKSYWFVQVGRRSERLVEMMRTGKDYTS